MYDKSLKQRLLVLIRHCLNLLRLDLGLATAKAGWKIGRVNARATRRPRLQANRSGAWGRDSLSRSVQHTAHGGQKHTVMRIVRDQDGNYTVTR